MSPREDTQYPRFAGAGDVDDISCAHKRSKRIVQRREHHRHIAGIRMARCGSVTTTGCWCISLTLDLDVALVCTDQSEAFQHLQQLQVFSPELQSCVNAMIQCKCL